MSDGFPIKQTAWLIFILVVFSAVALTVLWLSRDNQHAVGFLSAMATFVSIPVAALVSLFLVSFRLKPNTSAEPACDLSRSPIFVVGNGSRDVRVVVGPEGVTLTVGEPVSELASAPAPVLLLGRASV